MGVSGPMSPPLARRSQGLQIRTLISAHPTQGTLRTTCSFHDGREQCEWCYRTAPGHHHHASQGELRDSAAFITCSNAAQHSRKATAGGGALRIPNQDTAIPFCQVMQPRAGHLGGARHDGRETARRVVPRRTVQRLDRRRSVVHSRPVWGWWVPRVIWVVVA